MASSKKSGPFYALLPGGAKAEQVNIKTMSGTEGSIRDSEELAHESNHNSKSSNTRPKKSKIHDHRSEEPKEEFVLVISTTQKEDDDDVDLSTTMDRI